MAVNNNGDSELRHFDVSKEMLLAEQQSAFEYQHRLIDAASNAVLGRLMINAGRGNPNFLLTTVRDSFAQLLLFST